MGVTHVFLPFEGDWKRLSIIRVFATKLRDRCRAARKRSFQFNERKFYLRTDETELKSVTMIISSLGIGGAERQACLTIEGLRKRGLNVSVLCRTLRKGESEEKFGAREWSSGSGSKSAIMTGMSLHDHLVATPAQIRDDILSLAHQLREIDPDVVHVWQSTNCPAGGMAATLLGIPCVLNVRSTVQGEDRRRDSAKIIYQHLYRHPRVRCLANSKAGARDFERWLDLPRGAFDIVRNGVECPVSDGFSASRLRKALNLPADGLIVGGLFRLDLVKDPLLWMATAALVAKRRPDIRFAIAGDGPMRPEILDRASALGLHDRLMLVGNVSDTASFLRVCTVLLLTSTREGLPNVLLESQAVGTPVVATNVGGVPEAVRDGKTGYVGERHAPLLADRLLSILNDDALRASMREAGPKFVCEQFGIERLIDETLEIYRKCRTGEHRHLT